MKRRLLNLLTAVSLLLCVASPPYNAAHTPPPVYVLPVLSLAVCA